jgi:hypothetical protein
MNCKIFLGRFHQQDYFFQMTGYAENSCAVKAGRMMSAKKILIGTVLKMGGKIVTSGRLVDVKKVSVSELPLRAPQQSTNLMKSAFQNSFAIGEIAYLVKELLQGHILNNLLYNLPDTECTLLKESVEYFQ